jgi:hypothetical protein
MGQVATIGPEHRPHQQEAWDNQKRFNILVWHRRAGKTVYAIKWLIKHTLRGEPQSNRRGAYLAPLYRQAKLIAWSYLKEYTRDIPGTTFNESELRAVFANGAEIRLLGAAEPDSLRGLYLDAVVCDEMAQFSPRAWTEIVRPALADRKGKALLIGTVFGRANLFYDYWMNSEGKDDWYRQLLTVNDTDALDAEEVEAMRGMMDESEFSQELLCDWDAAVKGSYFGKLMNAVEQEGRATSVPHDPDMTVISSWDLGMADSTVVVLWQRLRTGEVRAIECLEFQNTGLAEIVKELKDRPYNYAEHILPHDAKVRELGTGKSRVEVLRSLGVNPTICKSETVQDGIQAVRSLLPRVWFDRKKCFRLIEALKTYRSDYSDERQVFNKTPAHTWESHFADAVRYFALMERFVEGPQWKELDYSQFDRAVV